MYKPEEIMENLVIDVREKSEWDFWNCRHATLVPLGQLQNWLQTNKPATEKKVFLFCRSGNRSEMAKNYMESIGYKDVVNLGGLEQLAQIAMMINEKENYEGK